jgi:hypothetical protein
MVGIGGSCWGCESILSRYLGVKIRDYTSQDTYYQLAALVPLMALTAINKTALIFSRTISAFQSFLVFPKLDLSCPFETPQMNDS